MATLVSWIQHWVREKPGAILWLFLAALLLATWGASRVSVSAALEHILIADDPEQLRNIEIKSEFSNDEILVVAFDLKRRFGTNDLRQLDRVATRIGEIPGVEEVIGLSNVEDVRGDGESIDASPLVDLERMDGSLEQIRERVSRHRLYAENLISNDQTTLALVVILEFRDRSEQLNIQATRAALAIAHEEAGDWDAWISGYPAAEYESSEVLGEELPKWTALGLIIILLLTYAVTRSVFGIVSVLAVIVFSELVAFAWFGFTATPLTLPTAPLPAVLIATAATYALYFLGLLHNVSDADEPAIEAVALVTRPALLSALSTGVGFLSLNLAPVNGIGDLGTSLAVGIAAAAATTLLLLPVIVKRWDVRIQRLQLAGLGPLAGIGLRWARRPRRTLLGMALLVALIFAGVSRLIVDSDPLKYWAPDSYHRTSDAFINDKLSGTLAVNLLVHGQGHDGALEPRVIALLDRLLKDAETDPIVDRSISFLDYVYLMDAAMRPEQAPRTVLPSSDLAAQYLLLYESGGDPRDYRHYINHDRSTLNAFLRVNSRSSSEVRALRERIYDLAASLDPETKVEVLGTWWLFPKAMDGITRSMVIGLALATLLITFVMAVTLRSVRMALVGIIPNIVPILACVGLMGWVGVPLSYGAAIAGCISLGLAVDDTAHVLGHLGHKQSLAAAYSVVGPCLIITSLVLVSGFFALTLSDFAPVMHLGMATVLTLTVALLCDLLMLPSLLVVFGDRVLE